MPKEYDDQRMHAYFASLPAAVQQEIRRSGVHISTLGELQLYGEHLRTLRECEKED
ncbi:MULTISPECIES: hypothetical protein [Oscillospiraceae]|uniref:Uncharacterized protein n=1 Tax=Harryflintia acetispora TaxID=1849041 RepID=A0A9X8Y8W4_9FIRM|nr:MULTISPECIES: hypothetical protein [Oscillospiraceae]TCL44441.1 hypothetical protein EDD78_10256 [Harryflintia acetispora]